MHKNVKEEKKERENRVAQEAAPLALDTNTHHRHPAAHARSAHDTYHFFSYLMQASSLQLQHIHPIHVMLKTAFYARRRKK